MADEATTPGTAALKAKLLAQGGRFPLPGMGPPPGMMGRAAGGGGFGGGGGITPTPTARPEEHLALSRATGPKGAKRTRSNDDHVMIIDAHFTSACRCS